jgi:hypothetical protein
MQASRHLKYLRQFPERGKIGLVEQKEKTMTITYSNGRSVEAVLLARSETTIRVALEDTENVMEFSDIDGTWRSADCEPVLIEFAWQKLDRKPAIAEADCCCSSELAASLIQSLFADSSEDELVAAATH